MHSTAKQIKINARNKGCVLQIARLNQIKTLYLDLYFNKSYDIAPRARASGVLGKSTIPPQARKLNPGIVNRIANGLLAMNQSVCLETK